MEDQAAEVQGKKKRSSENAQNQGKPRIFFHNPDSLSRSSQLNNGRLILDLTGGLIFQPPRLALQISLTEATGER